MGSLLEALAWCRSLRALDLHAVYHEDDAEDAHAWQPFPASGCAALAKLQRLTELDLSFRTGDRFPLTHIVYPLVALTGLVVLNLSMSSGTLPAALGQLKGLQSLQLLGIHPCVLEAGCLNLPNLQSLVVICCCFEHAEMLPSITALQSLTFIHFAGTQGLPVFAQLIHLPQLEHMRFHDIDSYYRDEGLETARLPADMGFLCSALLRLSFHGHNVTQFPLALTQLVALQWLSVDMNDFTELPTATTALSRLVKLDLGRHMSIGDPLQLHDKQPLDVCALGDLSAFPALRELSFSFCEVLFCESLLNAVQHPSLVKILFRVAHPAPECAPMVLQLSKELKKLKRGSVLGFASTEWNTSITHMLQEAQGCSPYQRFMAAVKE